MVEALSKAQTPTMISKPIALPIDIKLDGFNYGIWSSLVEMYIYSKDKLGYINNELTMSSPIDLPFWKWHPNNAIIKGWPINSMDSTLIENFIRPNRRETLLPPPIFMTGTPLRFMILSVVSHVSAKQMDP